MSATPSENESHDVVIVGAGLAGLSCAKKLAASHRSVVLLEATDRVGGRVRTDHVDGLTLDHGFQVLLTAYPACQTLLDYDALRLRPFEPGALIRCGGKFSCLGDPWRRPLQALSTALSPVGSFGDKLKIGRVRSSSGRGSLQDLYERPEEPTIDRLHSLGFSEAMIDQFFRPFLGGVFLDETLGTSSRMMEFVFRMFAAGDIAIPAEGMAAIPRQLAEGLPRGAVRLRSTVSGLEHHADHSVVHLTDGSSLSAKHIVVATESNAAARLLDVPELETQWGQTTTLYYSAQKSPLKSKTLMLRGDEIGPIQTAVVLSDVAPEYATRSRALISVSVSEDKLDEASGTLDQLARQQLEAWFGDDVGRWEHVQTYQVPYGLPKTDLDPVMMPVSGSAISEAGLPDHVYVCGDHRETPSIQGAMNSGLRVSAVIAKTIS